jgi:two-component system chemotaxis response regulator CheY
MSLPTGTPQNGSAAPTVLIVEDDAATRRLYKFLLTNGGYLVLEAEDGLAAVELLAQNHCSLVITDMNMPRMDGMELIKHIRSVYGDLYVILITAFGTPDTEKNALRIGANDYLSKPFEFEELEGRVRAFFQSRSQSVR